jgi:hypothetical protein
MSLSRARVPNDEVVMDFKEAAANEAVVDILRCIEDKLYETGLLVTATDDSESDVTIAFEKIVVGGEEIQALVVSINANVPSTPRRFLGWEPIRHYVMEKYSALQDELLEDVREPLLDSLGPVVFLNGVSTI